MRIVDPIEARKGDYIDTFTRLNDAEKAEARLERILKNTGVKRELVLVCITSAAKSWQMFLLP